MNKKVKDLFKDIFIFALGSFGSRIIIFFLVPLYTHLLTTDEYGIADLVFTAGQLILPVVSLTIFDAVLRFGLMKENETGAVLRCAARVFWIGSAVTLLCTPLFGLYKPIAGWKWYLSAYIIALFASSTTFIYLKVKGRNKLYAVLSVIQTGLLAVFNVLLLCILDLGIRGYLLSTILSNGISAVLAVIFGGLWKDVVRAGFNGRLLSEMVRYSAPMILNSVSWWVIQSSDKVMIEWMVDSSSLGIYTAASKIPALLNVFVSCFSQAWDISSIKEYDSGSDSKFFSDVLKYYYVFIFGVCIMISTICKPFMRLYVGESFFAAWSFVPLLLAAAAFSAFSSYAGALYGAIRKSKNVMWTTLAAGAINVIVNYLLIPRLKIWGAVIGTVTAYFAIAVIRLLDTRRYLGLDIHFRRGGILAVITLCHAVLVSTGANIVLVSAAAIILYAIAARKELCEVVSKLRELVLHRKTGSE